MGRGTNWLTYRWLGRINCAVQLDAHNLLHKPLLNAIVRICNSCCILFTSKASQLFIALFTVPCMYVTEPVKIYIGYMIA